MTQELAREVAAVERPEGREREAVLVQKLGDERRDLLVTDPVDRREDMLPPITSFSRKRAYRSRAEWWSPGKPRMTWTCSRVFWTMFTPGFRVAGVSLRATGAR